MATLLHRAIEDAFRDASAYREKGILVTAILEATHPLEAHETLLYESVYTLFRALPERLVRGSIFYVSTHDCPGGVELLWETREEIGLDPPKEAPPRDVRSLLRAGPYGDLLDVALLALESFCEMRMGYVEERVEPLPSSSAFDHPPELRRRVLAFIPVRSHAAPVAERALESPARESPAPEESRVAEPKRPPPDGPRETRRAPRPRPRVSPVPRARTRP